MANTYFQFRQFIIHQDKAAMKVTTDGCFFGAWVADKLSREKTEGKHMLDIGAGTGLLSLMVAQKTAGMIDSIELDAKAAMQARDNVKISPWMERIQIWHADILQFHPTKTYDYIFTNPPFYEREFASQTEYKNIAHHGDGLLLTELFSRVKQLLAPSGKLYALLPFKRQNEIISLLKKNDLHPHEMIVVKPTTKAIPSRILLEAGLGVSEKNIQKEVCIGDTFFKTLLEDYYLRS